MTTKLTVAADDPLGAKLVNRWRAQGLNADIRTSRLVMSGFALLERNGKPQLLKLEDDSDDH